MEEKIRLDYLPANQAWAFVWGNVIIRLKDGPLFFVRRIDAVLAAKNAGLLVLPNNDLTVNRGHDPLIEKLDVPRTIAA